MVGTGWCQPNRRPADVRDFELWIGGRQFDDIARNPAKPQMHPMFNTARRQQLHSDADTKKGALVVKHRPDQGLLHAG